MDVATRQDYPAQFRRFITNGLSSVVAGVRGERWQHASDEQKEALTTRALHLLGFIVSAPDFWHQTFELMQRLSPYMEKQGRWAEWLPYLQSGSQVARGIGDLEGAVKLDVWVAVSHRSMGRYAEARKGLQNCAAQFDALGDDLRYARTLNRLAWTERLAGDLKNARKIAADALVYLTADDDDCCLERAEEFLDAWRCVLRPG